MISEQINVLKHISSVFIKVFLQLESRSVCGGEIRHGHGRSSGVSANVYRPRHTVRDFWAMFADSHTPKTASSSSGSGDRTKQTNSSKFQCQLEKHFGLFVVIGFILCNHYRIYFYFAFILCDLTYFMASLIIK